MIQEEKSVGAASRWMLAVLLLAGLLRAPFLVGYGIDDDEFYTLRYSETLLETPTPPAVKSWPILFTVTRGLSELFRPSPLALRPPLCLPPQTHAHARAHVHCGGPETGADFASECVLPRACACVHGNVAAECNAAPLQL